MPARVLALPLAALLLTGCALQPTATSSISTTGTNAAGKGIVGKVFGGNQPVVGSTITVYEAGFNSGYGAGAQLLSSTTTDQNGNFSFASDAYGCNYPNSPLYIVAIGGNPGGGSNNPNLALMASLGPCATAKTETVNINEVTTVATVFSLAQFMGTTLGSGVTPEIGGPGAGGGVYNRGLIAAMNNTYPQLVNNATGTALASSYNSSSQVTVTTEAAKINTIANILSSCVNSAGETSTTETSTNCGQLFSGVNATGASPRPYNTIQAALMMALYPWYNVSKVAGYAPSIGAPFVGLSGTPNDWTIAVSYATSLFGVGVTQYANPSMTLDIDSTGRIWFPDTASTNYSKSGIGYFDPSAVTFNGPYGDASQPQNVAIDTSGNAWTLDLTSGSTLINGVSTTALTNAYNSTLSGEPLSNRYGPFVQSAFLNYANLVQVPYTTVATTGLYTDIWSAQLSPDSSSTYNEAGNVSGGNTTVAGTSTSSGILVTGGFGTLVSTLATNFYATSGPVGSTALCTIYSDENGYAGSAVESAPTTPCTSGGITQNGHSSSKTSYSYAGPVAVMATSSSGVCYYDPAGPTGGCVTPTAGLNNPQGIATDGADNLWIANSGNGSITTMGGSYKSYASTATVPYLHDATHGGTLTDPYALGIDGSGNVWTISPGCVSASTTPCNATGMLLTELVGAAAPTNTPLNYANSNNLIGTKPTF